MQKCEGSFVIGVWGYGLTMSFFWAYLSSCLFSLGGCRGAGVCHSMHCERGKLHHGHVAIISKGQHTDNSGLNRGDFLLWGQHWASITPQLIPLCPLPFHFVVLHWGLLLFPWKYENTQAFKPTFVYKAIINVCSPARGSVGLHYPTVCTKSSQVYFLMEEKSKWIEQIQSDRKWENDRESSQFTK